MPCWEVRTVTVELAVANEKMLHKAMEALGYTVRVTTAGWQLNKNGRLIGTYRNGKVELQYGVDASVVNDIKQSYAKEGLKLVAKRYGAQLQPDRNNRNRYTIQLDQRR